MVHNIDQATLIILDIGRNVSMQEEKKVKSFFENAKECASRIIERKILSQGKNLIGIMLLGSKKTKNNMAEQSEGAFRHIELLAELQTPTWQMIRNLPETPSKSKGEWLDSLIVAADHFKNGVSGVKIVHKKIILMTNLQVSTSLSSQDVEQVLHGFKEEGFEVDIIGPDIYEDNPKNSDVKLARQFVASTNGATATFEHVMSYLLFHKKKAVKPMPWNVDLSIGPNLKIPVSAYIRLKDEPVVGKWKKAINDPVSSAPSTTEGVKRDRIFSNIENQSTLEQSEVIKGYHYGQQIIPFSKHDELLLYKSGEKTLSVYGFTHASNIHWQNLNGEGLSYVFGRKGDKKAQEAVRCLVECLHELNLVGVVRSVYCAHNAPKMYVLMPVIDTNNYVCLSKIAICYKDDIKYMAFPPTNLKKYACTKEQVNAFKDLIKAMDLTKAYDETFDDTEAFPIAETVSPSAQYVLDCIAYRAMNPGKPLPQPRDEIMSLFLVPPLIEKRSREPLEKVKKLFTLNKLEVKTKKRTQPILNDETLQQPSTSSQPDNDITVHDMPKIKLPITNISKVVKIGTIDPVHDYIALADEGKGLADLAPGMSEAIESLIYCNLDGNYVKALDAMMHFKKECVKTDPSHYNNWLKKFKAALTDRKRYEVLSLIPEKGVNYILKCENNLSTYDSEQCHEESQLYENDTQPNSTELTIRTEVNDMFDEM